MTFPSTIRLDDDDPEKEKKENEGMRPDQPMAPVQMALFKSRTVLIFGEIDMKVAERVCGQLLAYTAEG
ncbi:MAG: ATP-dependent Clp protease proteolytic subunit, partial [Alphaproteobacteria bacterium]|nr:ATP-dependent Clp protease proteolytic subunit [Alphaproteobacteria bacterium]